MSWIYIFYNTYILDLTEVKNFSLNQKYGFIVQFFFQKDIIFYNYKHLNAESNFLNLKNKDKKLRDIIKQSKQNTN